MTNIELIKMIKSNDELQELEFTKDIKATYFIDEEGKQLSFGYDKYLGRLNDHRIIFGLIEGIARNDFDTLIKETRLLVYMPESNEALWLKGVELSEQQKAIINKYDIDIIFE